MAFTIIHKRGRNYIAWTDVGGAYQETTLTLPDGRPLPVLELTNGTADRRFLLTNPDEYSLTYNGLIASVEKRLSQGWHMQAAYAYSVTKGLLVSSGGAAGDAQASTIAAAFPNTEFGRDPNNLTNAYGRLPNDRPHMVRLFGTVDVPGTGIQVSGNLQSLSGKPWAATAQVSLKQGDQRILLEPRGSRRLSSQTLLDFRVSRPIRVGKGSVDLMLDVLNVLNDAGEENLVSDTLYTYHAAP